MKVNKTCSKCIHFSIKYIEGKETASCAIKSQTSYRKNWWLMGGIPCAVTARAWNAKRNFNHDISLFLTLNNLEGSRLKEVLDRSDLLHHRKQELLAGTIFVSYGEVGSLERALRSGYT